MIEDNAKLLEILGIAHDSSIRGIGISLQEALRRTGYSQARTTFDANNLLPIIRSHPALVQDWILYSLDKRTLGGWYVLEDARIGRIGFPESELHFATQEEAVAEFIVRELDYWTSVSAG